MKKNQIPTAEEFCSTNSLINDLIFVNKLDSSEISNLCKSLITFAKLHVTEALNEVYLQNEEILSKEIVMNSYSLNKIK
jgi:hypothetical protein